MSRKRRKRRKIVENTEPIKTLTSRTKNQAKYIKAIEGNDITFCSGPAGTGKTHVAIGMAVKMVQMQQLRKIVITRPLISVGKDIGYLPGDINSKIGPYVVPCFDELNYYIDIRTINAWLAEQKIEILPLSMMRGRTLNNSFVICDEAQNATYNELKMLLTRIGEQSKFVFTGDLEQSDLSIQEWGLDSIMRRLKDIPGIDFIELTKEDIVRHKLISIILSRL